MSKYFIFSFFILVGFSFTSCKKQPIITSEATVDEINNFIIKEIDFNYFSSKAKFNYKDATNDVKANANIRIKKDSIIWVSFNAAAGFEAFRCMITKDSIYIIDRLKNEYSVLDFDGLSQRLNTTLNFQMIQAMIMGNLMVTKTKNDKLAKADTSYTVLKQINGDISIDNYVRTSTMKIENVEIKQVNNGDNLSIKYFNFVSLGDYSFPGKNEIVLNHKEGSEDQTIKIDIDHNKSEFPDKELNFPFNVPNKFTRK